MKANESDRVKINLDSVEKISGLYGIGSKLAERIARYRELHNPLEGPDDLAQVDGISHDLAKILDTMIDWQNSSTQDLAKRDKAPTVVITIINLVFGVLVFLSMIFLEVIPNFAEAVTGSSSAIVLLSVYVPVLASFLLYFLGFVVLIGGSLPPVTKLSRNAITIANAIWTIGLSGIFIGSVSLFLQISWNELFNDLLLVGILILVFFYLSSILPIGVVVFRPSYAVNPWVSGLFDLAVLSTGPILAWTAWLGRNTFSPIHFLAYLICGAVFFWIGIHLVRTGRSPFQGIIKIVIPKEILEAHQTSKRYWMSWLNARLPDPMEQQALKEALDDVYKPSLWRSVAGGIILAIGIWLLTTSLGAIVEWFVQDWLEDLVR